VRSPGRSNFTLHFYVSSMRVGACARVTKHRVEISAEAFKIRRTADLPTTLARKFGRVLSRFPFRELDSSASPRCRLLFPFFFFQREKYRSRSSRNSRRRVSFRFENALARARTASGVFIRARFANRDSSAIFGARATARVSLCVYYERENAIGKISHRQSLRGCRPIKSTSTRSETRYDTRASTATINRKHRRDDEKGASREFQSTTRAVRVSERSKSPSAKLARSGLVARSIIPRADSRSPRSGIRPRALLSRARESASPPFPFKARNK